MIAPHKTASHWNNKLKSTGVRLATQDILSWCEALMTKEREFCLFFRWIHTQYTLNTSTQPHLLKLSFTTIRPRRQDANGIKHGYWTNLTRGFIYGLGTLIKDPPSLWRQEKNASWTFRRKFDEQLLIKVEQSKLKNVTAGRLGRRRWSSRQEKRQRRCRNGLLWYLRSKLWTVGYFVDQRGGWKGKGVISPEETVYERR